MAGDRTAATLKRIALSYRGYVEKPVNRTKFGKELGADGEPWCASYASVCLEEAGFGHEFWSASAQELHDQFVAKGMAGTKCKPLSVVGYHMPGEHAGINHTGIVLEKHAAWMKTIEGNTSSGIAGSQVNGGGVYVRTRTYANVVGYGYPPFAAAPIVVPTGYLVSARTRRVGNLGLVFLLATNLGDSPMTASRSDGSEAFLVYAGASASLRIAAYALTRGIVCKRQAYTGPHDPAALQRILAGE